MSILGGPCGLENVKKIAYSMMPENVEWEIYHYPGRVFITKIEDPNTGRWAIVDCREKLSEDEIRDRISLVMGDE